MAQILDYSGGYPGAVSMVRLGFDGAVRYLRKEGASSVQPLTVSEVADLRAYKRTLALIYQHVSRSRVLEGRAAGRHDAEWALARARECGVEPRAIYFAVDFDTVSAAQWAAVREYMLGAGEVLGLERIGTYGEYDLLDYLFARGAITWGWQTYAWSIGHNHDDQPRHPRAHLFQRIQRANVGGIDCDVNDVLAKSGDYGQTPAPQEEDMPLTRTDLDAIREMIKYEVLAAGDFRFSGRNVIDMLVQTTGSVLDIQGVEDKQLAALTALTDDEANILGALRALPTGAQVDTASLAAALGPILAPLINAGATPAQVEDAVRHVFASAGQAGGNPA